MYHKPPTAFVDGNVELKRMLPARASGDTDGDQEAAGATSIPEPGSLIGDFLEMDIGGTAAVPRGQGRVKISGTWPGPWDLVSS